jgi:hypothetical protein
MGGRRVVGSPGEAQPATSKATAQTTAANAASAARGFSLRTVAIDQRM